MKFEKLQDLNGICLGNTKGIYKQWVYNKDSYMRMCDYMQKINYSIQDINELIDKMKKFDRKNVICCIVWVDWIKEAVEKIFEAIKTNVIKNFIFSKSNEIEKYKKYFTAIRSFIVAHPLSTSRHESYGFDGNYICVDIRDYSVLLELKDKHMYYCLNTEGLKETNFNYKNDFYLYCYSDKDDNMKYFRKIGCNYIDILKTAELYIDELYELNKYLSKLKKINFKC